MQLLFSVKIQLDWCVRNRRSWGINWRDLSSVLVAAANSITPGPAASLFITTKEECVARAQATFLYWRQRSKVKWDSLGDCHSKLLFASVQARKRKNNISSLQNVSGEWITSPPVVRTLISDFYSNLYEVHRPVSDSLVYDWDRLQLPCLSQVNKEFLMVPFSPVEIRSAMFNISDNKSPGPDGFSAAFFKTHWDKVGSLVITAVHFFFAHGFMLKDWNRTFLVLIPKIQSPSQVSHFRPIGLCNVIYKCITKCLTHRLRSVLPSLISVTQNAFVPDRLMSDEFLITHELLSLVNRTSARKKFFAVIKLDMNKAYDRVRWEFLFQSLKAFGFPPYWVHIIRQCVTTVLSSSG